MSLENFEAIFGKVKAEWENPSCNLPLHPFIFHLHALDTKHLRIHVTDFHSYTWESVKSIPQLEDMREDAGVGGPLSEFINYLKESIKSDNVKLVLGGSKLSESGANFAKLIAHKSKGMPLINIYLDKLVNSCASDAIAYLSWEIFKTFKNTQELVIKEQHRTYELTERLAAEKEKTETIQARLVLALSSKKQKLSRSNESDKRSPVVAPLIDLDARVVSETNSLGKPPTQVSPVKVGSFVPAYGRYYHRSKVRRIFLNDSDDGDGI